MARTGISYEQVEQAANALVAAGKNPTIAAVRESLGTGSAGTIHRFLTQYRESAPVAVKPARDVPEGLQAALVAEIDRAAAGARAEVEEKLIQTRQEADTLSADLEAMEAERDALAEQVAALTTERDALAGQSQEQTREIERQAGDIERERQAAEAARVEIAKVQIRAEDQAAKLDIQAAELANLKTALAASDKARQAAEQSAAVVSAKLEACEAAGVELRERMGKAKGRADKAEQSAQAKAGELATANVTIQVVQARLEVVERELTSARKIADEAAELKGELTATRAALKKAGG